MEKNKNNALQDFISMIENSWTFQKLTEEEQAHFYNAFEECSMMNALKGTYEQRFEILHTVYFAFLEGVVYNGFEWRKTNE